MVVRWSACKVGYKKGCMDFKIKSIEYKTNPCKVNTNEGEVEITLVGEMQPDGEMHECNFTLTEGKLLGPPQVEFSEATYPRNYQPNQSNINVTYPLHSAAPESKITFFVKKATGARRYTTSIQCIFKHRAYTSPKWESHDLWIYLDVE